MITLSSETLFHIGNFPVTNTVTDTLLVDLIIFGLSYYVYKNAAVVPGKFQSAVELIYDGFYSLTDSVTGKNTKKIFPFVMTFFLFILISNWSGLIPVITNIFVKHGSESIPLFRSASTDLNTTIALALCSLVATHAMSIRAFGIKKYISRFLSLNPLALYTGLLELVSEFTKIISFSFRLFGNVFVGEVMLLSITTAFAFLLPIPVMLYELFVGIIQATIFGLLTMAFMAIFTTPHGEH